MLRKFFANLFLYPGAFFFVLYLLITFGGANTKELLENAMEYLKECINDKQE